MSGRSASAGTGQCTNSRSTQRIRKSHGVPLTSRRPARWRWRCLPARAITTSALRRLQLTRVRERRPAARRARRGHRLAVDADASSTQHTTRSPGIARRSAVRTAVISSRTFSARLARAEPDAWASRMPSITLAAVSPGARPRRLASSRTMISSNAPAAIAPYSSLVLVAPVARDAEDADRPARPAARRRRRRSGPTWSAPRPSSGHEVGQLAHPVDVVAVVDDDPDAADVDAG